MSAEEKYWISVIQGMDWEACCPCETRAVITAMNQEEAVTNMEAHANGLEAVVVPNSLKGPYSMDEFLAICCANSGRYLSGDEAEKTKALLVEKGFLKS